MQPSRALFQRLAQLVIVSAKLQTDAPNVLKLHLIKSPFIPGVALAIGDVDLESAHFHPLDIGGNETMLQHVDPLTAEYVGGAYVNKITDNNLLFQPFTGVTTPLTFYGVALTNTDFSELLATQAFATPITINATNQGLRAPWPEFRFAPTILR